MSAYLFRQLSLNNRKIMATCSTESLGITSTWSEKAVDNFTHSTRLRYCQNKGDPLQPLEAIQQRDYLCPELGTLPVPVQVFYEHDELHVNCLKDSVHLSQRFHWVVRQGQQSRQSFTPCGKGFHCSSIFSRKIGYA